MSKQSAALRESLAYLEKFDYAADLQAEIKSALLEPSHEELLARALDALRHFQHGEYRNQATLIQEIEDALEGRTARKPIGYVNLHSLKRQYEQFGEAKLYDDNTLSEEEIEYINTSGKPFELVPVYLPIGEEK